MSFNLPRSLSRTAWRSYGTVQGSPSAASIASRVPSVLVEATSATAPRTNWTPEEVSAVYHTPLNQLTYASVSISNYKSDAQYPHFYPSQCRRLIAEKPDIGRASVISTNNVHSRLLYTDASMTPRPSKCAPS
jgi:hypothetical protein